MNGICQIKKRADTWRWISHLQSASANRMINLITLFQVHTPNSESTVKLLVLGVLNFLKLWIIELAKELFIRRRIRLIEFLGNPSHVHVVVKVNVL